ncbi:MAG: hypothetical protein JO215_09085 [Ktedonobacteraceae bacterium]|nr:hypothetical protein [Ktedonobacteraceae bacterium]
MQPFLAINPLRSPPKESQCSRASTRAYLETSELHVLAQRLFTSVGFTHLSTWQWYAKAVEQA